MTLPSSLLRVPNGDRSDAPPCDASRNLRRHGADLNSWQHPFRRPTRPTTSLKPVGARWCDQSHQACGSRRG